MGTQVDVAELAEKLTRIERELIGMAAQLSNPDAFPHWGLWEAIAIAAMKTGDAKDKAKAQAEKAKE